MCKRIYRIWDARGGYFRVHTLALIGSVLCSHYKCSLSPFVSEIEYHRTDKRCGVTNSLQFIVYVQEMGL
jgi:hypothetical protein